MKVIVRVLMFTLGALMLGGMIAGGTVPIVPRSPYAFGVDVGFFLMLWISLWAIYRALKPKKRLNESASVSHDQLR